MYSQQVNSVGPDEIQHLRMPMRVHNLNCVPFMRRKPKRIRLANISTVYSCQKLYGDYFLLTDSCGNLKFMSGQHTFSRFFFLFLFMFFFPFFWGGGQIQLW